MADHAPLGVRALSHRSLVAVAAIAAAMTLASCAPEPPTAATPTASYTPYSAPTPTLDPNMFFEGTVDYTALVARWESSDHLARADSCREFLDSNLPERAPVTQNSTGPEVVTWWGEGITLAYKLVNDKRDPRNLAAGLHIAECLTSVHSEGADGRNDVIDSLELSHKLSGQSDWEGIEESHHMDPATVTRYTDGTFVAQGTIGNPYNAKLIEGDMNSRFSNLTKELYAWDPNLDGFTLVIRVSADTVASFPNETRPPIVLDPARQDAPW